MYLAGLRKGKWYATSPTNTCSRGACHPNGSYGAESTPETDRRIHLEWSLDIGLNYVISMSPSPCVR